MRLLLSLLAALLCAAPAAARPPLVTFDPPLPAPGFILPDVNGRAVALDAFAGRYVLLNFWATWCPPCVKEMPSMQQLEDRYRDRGVPFAVVAVSLDEEPDADVGAFVEALALRFTVLLDPHSAVGSVYGASALPSTFLLDPQGRVIAAAKGERDWLEAALLEQLDRMTGAR